MIKLDKQVRKKLRKYKRYVDWIDVFQGNIESGMGMSYEGISVKSNENHSAVENKVIQREKYYDEYKEKLEYCEAIESILDKLTDYERYIIEHKYNIVDIDKYKQYMIGQVPDAEIYNSFEFPYERTQYYKIKRRAYKRFKNMMKLVRFNEN